RRDLRADANEDVWNPPAADDRLGGQTEFYIAKPLIARGPFLQIRSTDPEDFPVAPIDIGHVAVDLNPIQQAVAKPHIAGDEIHVFRVDPDCSDDDGVEDADAADLDVVPVAFVVFDAWLDLQRAFPQQ